MISRRAVSGCNVSRQWILAGLYLWLGACGAGEPRQPVERAWTEDVLLEDGTVIQVGRAVKLDITNSWSGDAYNAVEREATLSFLGRLRSLPAWSAPYIPATEGVIGMPLLLYQDRATKEWVVVATASSCAVWRTAGKPKPPYWEYRLSSQGWHETPLSKASIGQKANLFHRYNRKLKDNHITVEERHRLENDPTTNRMYREIWGEEDIYFCGEGNPGK